MKKVEKKELTIKDLHELWNKHAQASKEEKEEMWKNETDYNKIMLCCIRNVKATHYKVITDKLVVDDLWEEEINLLTYGLKYYNINEFIYKHTGSIAMEIIIKLLQSGWEIIGTEDWAIEEKHNYAENKRYYVPQTGIVFRKKEVK